MASVRKKITSGCMRMASSSAVSCSVRPYAVIEPMNRRARSLFCSVAKASFPVWPDGLKTKAGSIVREPVHIVDVLPTLAELCRAPIPTSWPGRQLSPVSGVSLARIFAGETLGARPPIHFLFGTDRGLRDGDWKAVSFRSQPWELYNIPDDRTELNNLASAEPERLKKMVAEWHRMTEEVLEAPARSREPVSEEDLKEALPAHLATLQSRARGTAVGEWLQHRVELSHVSFPGDSTGTGEPTPDETPGTP